MNKVLILLALVYLGVSNPSFLLADNVEVFVGSGANNNKTICCGGDITLKVSSDIYDYRKAYEWVDENGVIVGSGRECQINNINTAHQYTLNIYSYDSTKEAVLEGGFENAVWTGSYWRNKNFQTDYIQKAARLGQVQSEKTCTIGNNPHSYHTGFKDMSAHSGNNMFIVNGGNRITDRVWAQEINIKSNTRYVFSLWAATIANGNPAKISFFVSDGALTNDDIINNTHNNRIGDPLTLPTNAGDFAQFYKMWNSNTFTGRKYITIVNQQTALGGNDFAIDDISFGGVKKEDNSYFVNVKMNINTSQIGKVAP